MKNMKLITLIILISISSSVFSTEQQDREKEVLDILTKQMKKEGVIINPEVAIFKNSTIESFTAFQMDGNFKKTEKSSNMLVIKNPDSPKINLSIGNSTIKDIGISISQNKTSQPYLSVSDSNGDGVFDLLVYSVLNKDGQHLVEINDYGMDGIIDFRWYIKENKFEIYFKNQMNSVLGTGKDSYILIDGKKYNAWDILAEIRGN